MSRGQRKRPAPTAIGGAGEGGFGEAATIVPTATPKVNAPPDRLAYRIEEVARMLGVNRRTIERERAAGRFPKSDVRIGRMPLWSRETLVRYVAEGGGR